MTERAATERLSVNRANTLRGREAISAFFDRKRNLRLPPGSVLRAAHTATASENPGLKFMIVVTKRVAKRAHDRNQLKRWIRAAITEIPAFAHIEAQAKEAGIEITLLISPNSVPSKGVNWESILTSVQAIPEKLRIQTSELRTTPTRLEATP